MYEYIDCVALFVSALVRNARRHREIVIKKREMCDVEALLL